MQGATGWLSCESTGRARPDYSQGPWGHSPAVLGISTKILHVADTTCLLLHGISSCPQWLMSWILSLSVSFNVRNLSISYSSPAGFLPFVFKSCLTFSLSIILQRCVHGFEQSWLCRCPSQLLWVIHCPTLERWEMGRIWWGKAWSWSCWVEMPAFQSANI